MNEQIIEIGRRLAGLREDCGYSVAELARALEIPENEYMAYENGEKDFSVERKGEFSTHVFYT